MNNTGFYITITDPQSLANLLKEGIDKKLIKTLPVGTTDKIFNELTYPIHIPIEVDSLVNLAGSNAIVKKLVGSKMDKAVSICLQKVIEAG